MTLPADIQGAILQAHKQGKSCHSIAEFYEVHVLAVKAVCDEDYMRKKREAAETERINRTLNRTAKHQLAVDRSSYRIACEQSGPFLSSQEGREALERVKQPYEAVLPERIGFRPALTLLDYQGGVE